MFGWFLLNWRDFGLLKVNDFSDLRESTSDIVDNWRWFVEQPLSCLTTQGDMNSNVSPTNSRNKTM